MSLCEDCQRLYDGWIDYKEPYRGWIQYQGYGQSAESYKAKARERRELVIRQTGMIVDSCRRNHQGVSNG